MELTMTVPGFLAFLFDVSFWIHGAFWLGLVWVVRKVNSLIASPSVMTETERLCDRAAKEACLPLVRSIVLERSEGAGVESVEESDLSGARLNL